MKLTGSPELAVATNPRVKLAAWTGIDPKVMVCCVLPVPVPLNKILCCAGVPGADTLGALSVNATAPLKLPAVDGVKLIGSKHA